MSIECHDCAGTLPISEDGRVLFGRKAGKKKWQLTKGHVDGKEKKIHTAKRETHEEGGVPPESMKGFDYLGRYSIVKQNVRKRIYVWLCSLEEITEAPSPTDSFYAESGFFDFDVQTLPDILRYPEEIDFCLKYQKKIQKRIDGLKAAFRKKLALKEEEMVVFS